MTDDQVRDVRDLTRLAGIKATTTKVHGPGHPMLVELAPGVRSTPGGLVPEVAPSGGGSSTGANAARKRARSTGQTNGQSRRGNPTGGASSSSTGGSTGGGNGGGQRRRSGGGGRGAPAGGSTGGGRGRRSGGGNRSRGWLDRWRSRTLGRRLLRSLTSSHTRGTRTQRRISTCVRASFISGMDARTI
ncbi:hypothetical protein [Nocardioides sp. B-3]|uniref:hypothetical protein n=1 Tax=Nocardioides sp. B-3 TaxID=2895565 RepID=UPI002153461B|nr:hypothetical protein [Nocardioides sp. B-3]UUZ61948.1 hypothetical protein LP418_11870 [Nocardioides sp. B-3]